MACCEWYLVTRYKAGWLAGWLAWLIDWLVRYSWDNETDKKNLEFRLWSDFWNKEEKKKYIPRKIIY